jgi:hypothetical protein
MFYPSTKAMLDLANSLKAFKAFKGLLSFPDPRSQAGTHRMLLQGYVNKGHMARYLSQSLRR